MPQIPAAKENACRRQSRQDGVVLPHVYDTTGRGSAERGQSSRKRLPGTRSPVQDHSSRNSQRPCSVQCGQQYERRRSLAQTLPDVGKDLFPGNYLHLPRIQFVNTPFCFLRPQPVDLYPTRRVQTLEQSVNEIDALLAWKREDLLGQSRCRSCPAVLPPLPFSSNYTLFPPADKVTHLSGRSRSLCSGLGLRISSLRILPANVPATGGVRRPVHRPNRICFSYRETGENGERKPDWIAHRLPDRKLLTELPDLPVEICLSDLPWSCRKTILSLSRRPP
jgi:hypothetical protein